MAVATAGALPRETVRASARQIRQSVAGLAAGATWLALAELT